MKYMTLILILSSCAGQVQNPDAQVDEAYENITLPPVEVGIGHWRAEWIQVGYDSKWTLCAVPSESVALWIVGSNKLTMLAHGTGQCIDETTNPLTDVPLQNGALYRAVALGQEAPEITLSH